MSCKHTDNPSKALPAVRSFAPCLSTPLGNGWVVPPGLAQSQGFPVCRTYLSKLELGYLNIFEA